MNTKRILVTFCSVSAVLLGIQPAGAYQAFTGKLVKEGDALVLIRCDVDDSRYVLSDSTAQSASLHKRLSAELAVGSGNVQLTVLGGAVRQASHNLLLVDRVVSIERDKPSCQIPE